MLAAATRRKYHFHILGCAIRSTSASHHGGNVQSSLKDNYRMSETLLFPEWVVETSGERRSLEAAETFRRATARAATQLWDNAERDH